jgi:hypothetical protein
MRTEVIVTMGSGNNDAEVAQVYVLGDEAAGRDVHLPRNEIRKLRKSGKLAGAFIITGHRSILYHRGRLRQRINDAFKTA